MVIFPIVGFFTEILNHLKMGRMLIARFKFWMMIGKTLGKSPNSMPAKAPDSTADNIAEMSKRLPDRIHDKNR